MFSEETGQAILETLDRLVMEILERQGIAGPPVNAFEVAAGLGVRIADDDRQAGRARRVRCVDHRGTGRETVLLKSDPRRERRQWALAHEIGEQLAARVFADAAIDPREEAPEMREQVANALAGRLLVPTEWLAWQGAAHGWDLPTLKAGFATASHELIARRMLECGPAMVLTIFDQGRLYLRRTNRAGRVPALSEPERCLWRRVHQEGRPRRAAGPGYFVQGWPIHEPGWQREILRLAFDDWE